MSISEPTTNAQRYAANNLLSLSSAELLLGMYVCELDCAWSKTPFPMGGFHLKNAEDIEVLAKHCKHVVIDTNKGAQPRRTRENQLTILSSARRSALASTSLRLIVIFITTLEVLNNRLIKLTNYIRRLKPIWLPRHSPFATAKT